MGLQKRNKTIGNLKRKGEIPRLSGKIRYNNGKRDYLVYRKITCVKKIIESNRYLNKYIQDRTEMAMNGFLTVVDVIAAKFATIACLIVFLKYVFMRLKFERVDAFFHKVHQPATVFFIIFALLHGLASLRVFDEVSIFIYLLGAIFFFAVVCTMATHFVKILQNRNRLKWHRMLAMLTLILFILHLIFGFWGYFQL